MSPALRGTRGLFSILQQQDTLSRGDRERVRLNQQVHDVAADFTMLVDSLAEHPTRLQELVPTVPSFVGACDACQAGMGGVCWLAPNDTHAPIVWRQRFAPHVARALVTSDNRGGSLSIIGLGIDRRHRPQRHPR